MEHNWRKIEALVCSQVGIASIPEQVGPERFLAVANAYDGVSVSVNSVIYQWSGALFAERQANPRNPLDVEGIADRRNRVSSTEGVPDTFIRDYVGSQCPLVLDAPEQDPRLFKEARHV